MSQPVTIQSLSQSAGANFAQPFEMLEACHERVHRMLALLLRLRDHLRAQGPDDQASQAARDVMRYFDQAAPQHHQDEELHVFPALLEQGDSATMAVVARLQQDHLQMESRWVGARAVLSAVERSELAGLSVEQEATLDAFASLYPDHIEAEEQIAYPAAAATMDAPAQAVMGAEMMRRRGVA